MANSDKNILITPAVGSTTDDPKIVFQGANASVGPQSITLRAYPDSNGTLSFEGSAGQLFSITNDLTGTIFSVNDVSGIPSIEVTAAGLVKIAEFSGNTLFGTGIDNGTDKVQINGNIVANVVKSNIATGTAPFTVNSTTVVTNLNADMLDGLHLNTDGRADNPNEIVRTDGSGYIYAGWINTTSGDNGTTAIDRVYASSDGFIRYYSPANFRTVLNVPTRTGGDASGTWSISVTGSAGSATTAGTVTTAAQPNITSVGTLTSLGVSGAVTASTLVSNVATGTAPLTVTSTTQVANLSVATAGTATNWGTYGGVPAAGTSFGTANTIGRSDANGYTFFGYINSSTANSENGTVSQVITTNGTDNYYRKASIAHLTSAVQTNASGSWAISITGNAATATTADQIDGVAFRNTGSNAGTAADTLDSNGITYYTSGVTNFSGNATDGALYSQAYSAAWQHQIAGDYRSGQIALRGKNNGTWQSWRTVLDSTNYTSYVGNGTLTLGVSGTGLSGSASFTANQSGNTTFTVTSNATNANTASTIVARDASGNFSAGTITATLSGSATSATTAGTVTTAAQPNITSVGTLTSLTVSGTTNLGAVGNVTITGGSSGQVLTTNGSGTLSWSTPSPTVPTSATPPGSPVDGNLWFDDDDGAVYIYYSDGTSNQWVEIGNSNFVAKASGSNTQVQYNSSGNLAASSNFTYNGTNLTVASGNIIDSKGDVRDLVINAQSTAYVLVAADAGKVVDITTGGVTVPNAVFSSGDAISIFNDSASNQTITQGGSVTMYLAGTATTGNRTLAQRGIATVLCVAANTFVISGAGLT